MKIEEVIRKKKQTYFIQAGKCFDININVFSTECTILIYAEFFIVLFIELNVKSFSIHNNFAIILEYLL